MTAKLAGVGLESIASFDVNAGGDTALAFTLAASMAAFSGDGAGSFWLPAGGALSAEFAQPIFT